MDRNTTSSTLHLILFLCLLLVNGFGFCKKIKKNSSRKNPVVFLPITVFISCVLCFSCHTYAQPDVVSTGKTKYFVALMRADYDDQDDLLEMYRSYLDDGDIALSHPHEDNLENTMQLPGQHGVQYFLLSEIRLNVASLRSQGVDIVSYDLEKENATYHELKDPVASVRAASELVHQNNMKFMISPSMMLTADFGTQFAPFVDIYNIQAQSLQSRPDEYNDFVEQTVRDLRLANPEISISAQVSTARGSLEGMKKSVASVIDIVDGTSSWYTDDRQGLNRLSGFLEWFNNNYR